MRSIRILTLALIPALACAPAFAQDTTDAGTAWGAPFERGRARLTMLVTGAAPINQNVRLQN
jgi:hypothetical protein